MTTVMMLGVARGNWDRDASPTPRVLDLLTIYHPLIRREMHMVINCIVLLVIPSRNLVSFCVHVGIHFSNYKKKVLLLKYS